MTRLYRVALVSIALALLCSSSAFAQPGLIEDIQVLGLGRMQRGAFMVALGVKVGQPYDPDLLRERFQYLWSLQLFRDIQMFAEEAPNGGKAIIIRVVERWTLQSVTYEDNKVVTRTEIEDRLKERGISLKLGKPIDMGAVFQTQTVISDMLAEKGYLDAIVDHQVKMVSETTRAVHFTIAAGGKTRIRKISFTGNEVFKDKKLMKQLKITQSRKWYWPYSQKNLYHPQKWNQDVTNVRNLYLNQGYLDVEIRPPIVEVRKTEKSQKKEDKRKKAQADADAKAAAAEATAATEPEPITVVETEEVVDPYAGLTAKQIRKKQKQEDEATRKQQKKEDKAAKKARKAEKKAQDKSKSWVYLTVPVKEGQQYTLGTVSVSGNEKFPDDMLRRAIPLSEGDVLRNDWLEAGVETITRVYENQGHLYATVVRQTHRHTDEPVADVEIVIDEDDPYYVGRIDIVGNSTTKDEVLRREILLNEGDLYSRDKLDVSKVKINQLGYFAVPGQPVIEPIEGKKQVRVNVLGEEQGRNEIQVGGGYSGVDGAFFNGVYSTRNFLGRGQVLSVALTIGGRASRYQLSFQEPWFLNKPILAGFNIFRQDVDYGRSLQSASTGFGIIFGKRLRRFGQFNIGYRYEEVSSTTFLTTTPIDDRPSSITTTNRISSITPVYTLTSINNPYRPNSGNSLNFSVQIAGGPLGGDTSYIKPVLRYTGYRKAWKDKYFALHGELGYVTEWADGSTQNSANINGVPRFQRFWLGGEILGPRVFETRSITPRRYVETDRTGQIVAILGDPRFIAVDDLVTAGGQPVLIEVGGDRYYLAQAELVWPLNQQAELAFFLDAGDALFDDQRLNLSTLRASGGVELRFNLPIFPVPLRLIYGWPVRDLPGDRSSSFTFSIGRSF